jgi:predicted alpha/beta hydrolase
MKDAITPETIRFTASAGWQLEADVFRADDPRVAILISAGTGYPRRFYADLASWLAARGALVMTYDYRGIGGSAGTDEAFSGIDLPHWGRFDLAAAIDALAERAGGLPMTHLAHSVGGHLVGLAENHARVSRHAFVSVGTGYFGGHHLKNIPLELFFWWGLGPYALARHGHIAATGGWRGEPLPPQLFRTWRRWSHRRAYFRPDLDGSMAPHYFDEVTAPIRSWVFPDDPIATPRAAADLLECYPAAQSAIIRRSPAEAGVRRIGHDGALRQGREKLWAEFLDWLAPL